MAPAPPPPQAPEFSIKMFAVPAMMIGVRMLKLDLTEYVVALRCLYGVATLLNVALYAYLYSLAAASTAPGSVTVIDKLPTETKKRTLKVGEYDREEATKKLKSALISFCVVAGIHYKWGSPMPLLFQSIMAPVNATDDPLVQIYLLGKTATGKLQRPFKVPNALGDLLGAGAGDDAAEPAAASGTTTTTTTSKKTE